MSDNNKVIIHKEKNIGRNVYRDRFRILQLEKY